MGNKFSKVCDERNDDWADIVRVRLSDQRCQQDLHTADARYHESCRKTFMSKRKISQTQPSLMTKDSAFEVLTQQMEKEKDKLLTSSDVYKKYLALGGSITTRWWLMKHLKDYFGSKLLVLSSPGINDILVFKEVAASMFCIEENDEDYVDTKSVAKEIVKEIHSIEHEKDQYHSRIDIQSAKSEVSPTLSRLLSEISKEGLKESSLPQIYIGNIITSIVSKRYTSLLVDLAVMVNKKELVEHLHEYSAVCSYDELKRFRSSAAFHASNTLNTTLRDHSTGLVQAVADNFDCNISSMNGLRQTHSLALMMIQAGEEDKSLTDATFPRKKMKSMREEDLKGVDFKYYTGSKKPEMPDNYESRVNLSPELTAKQEQSAKLNSEFDF